MMKKLKLFPVKYLLLSSLIVLMSSTFLHEDVLVGLKIGDKAPLAKEKLKSVQNKELSLSDLNGKNGLVVVFSCNSCPFVVGSDSFEGWEVQYNDLHAFAKEKNFEMVLINSNEAKRSADDSFDEMIKRANQKGYTMNYLLDVNSKFANAFGAKTTPHVFVFDKDLSLQYQGAIDNSVETNKTALIPYLKTALSDLANGKKVELNSTPPRGCSIKRVVKPHSH